MAEVEVTIEERRALAPRAGYCAGCLHLRLLTNGRSTFVRCALAETLPRWPRYPSLPVGGCEGFTPFAVTDARV